MNIARIFFSIFFLAFGVFMIIYGEMDDSPGGQLLGLLVIIASIVGVMKSRK